MENDSQELDDMDGLVEAPAGSVFAFTLARFVVFILKISFIAVLLGLVLVVAKWLSGFGAS